MPTTATVRVVALRSDFLATMTSRGMSSRATIAEHLGVAESTVGRLLNGDTYPSPGFIASALETTGLAFEELFETHCPDA